MDASIVGRDAVLDDVWTALGERTPVLIEGVAGIGKTAVLRVLLERATAADILVLSCSPTEAESSLPLAALADLLHPLADRVAALPGPQRAAAEAALLAGHTDGAVDERALATAARALIEAAAADSARGVLLAVDDAPWLDPPSERALRFVLRRVSGRIGVLVSSRTEGTESGQVPLGLDDPRLSRVGLGPLGIGALHHVLSKRFDVSLSRPLLARLARDSAGNPLVAIELTRAILRLPRPPAPGDDLPVAGSLQELVGATLATLPAPSRDAARLAALLTSPTLATLAAAGVDAGSIDAVEEAGLVEVTSDARIRFVHPVHSAAVRASIPPGVRRRLRGRLAEVCADPDERARQLAGSATFPDSEVAAELAEAGVRVRARGAPELAAEFYDRAAELTPKRDIDLRHARQLAAVQCRFDSGDYPAAGIQAEAIAEQTVGDARAEALLLRASIAWSADDLRGAVEAATRALSAAAPDTVLAGRIHAHLSVFVDLPEPARRHAEEAVALLTGRPNVKVADEPLAQRDRSTLAAALMQLFLNEVRAGGHARLDLLDQALRLEGPDPSWLAGTVPAIWWKGIDEHERARQRLCWMLDRAVAHGDEPFQHELLSHLGEAELLAGRYVSAARWIDDACDLGRQLATGLAGETWLRGMLDAHLGKLAEATQAAQDGLRQAEQTGDVWRRRINLQLAGVAALAGGRAAEAAATFAALAEAVDETGLVEPLGSRFEADWVEACVSSGDLATASVAQDRLAARHQRLPRPWTTLGVARGRALLASAAGQPADAELGALDEARGAVPADVVPFDRARCLLVAGVAHRRARRKRPARTALEAAAAEFDALGARAYARRARAELARIGGRPAAPLELSATEERVARMAAAGRTNRVIADALFVSPKTVEANLARVYRKLGIASRAELGAAMSTRPTSET